MLHFAIAALATYLDRERSFPVLNFHSKVIYRRCFLLAIEADFLLGLATFYWNPQKKGRKGEKQRVFSLWLS